MSSGAIVIPPVPASKRPEMARLSVYSFISPLVASVDSFLPLSKVIVCVLILNTFANESLVKCVLPVPVICARLPLRLIVPLKLTSLALFIVKSLIDEMLLLKLILPVTASIIRLGLLPVKVLLKDNSDPFRLRLLSRVVAPV